MPTPDEILRSARHVVVKDYPGAEIPDALTRAGLAVTLYDGPTENDVVVSELSGEEILHRPVGGYPDRADVLFVYRPISEVDAIIIEAQRLGAHTVWRHPAPGSTDTDSVEWRRRIEGAGLVYVDAPAINEVASRLKR